MNTFETLKNKINDLSNQLISFADSLEFEVKCEFTLENCSTTIPWNEIKGNGVYFIEIKNNYQYPDFSTWVENFRIEWENPIYKRRFVPNLKKKRITSQQGKFEDWIPLYIGKSKNIECRVKEHIFLKLDRNTFALKLNEREHTKKETFRLSIIHVPTDNYYDYNMIMPVVEGRLRKKLNPIIGKQ